MESKYTLYGTDFSLYTGKARAYLNYKNIPFDEVASTVKTYKNIIEPNTGVRFIPVVKTPDDVYLQDTTNIIDQLEIRHLAKGIYPQTAKQRLVSLLLELYGDEWLLLPAMHYRWNFDNFPFIYQEFGKIISPKLPKMIRGFLGKRIGNRFRDIVPLLGITKNTIPAIEDWYENRFLANLNEHFNHHPFLLGNAPSIGDFGFYGPLYAHLYRDPYPGALMKKIAPNVADWVERMSNAGDVEGDFVENDEIPETLIPILSDLFDVQWPVLEDTAKKLSEWYARETNDIHLDQPIRIPRRLGMHQFMIGEVREQRMILPYSLWMMQRPLNLYHSLSSDEKKDLEPLLKRVNGLYAMRFNLDMQVSRIDNQFVVQSLRG